MFEKKNVYDYLMVERKKPRLTFTVANKIHKIESFSIQIKIRIVIGEFDKVENKYQLNGGCVVFSLPFVRLIIFNWMLTYRTNEKYTKQIE